MRWILLLVVLLGGCELLVGRQADQAERERLQIDGRVTPVEDRKYTQMSVGKVPIRVEVVDTPERITLGLSYRNEIGADGMLFVFPRPLVPPFWMKGMKFDLDLVWIECKGTSNNQQETNKEECEVVDVTERAKAPGDPEGEGRLPYYQPDEEVNYVLEVPAGWVEENEVEVGDQVTVEG
jgi:uncharacterized membrane protein (UPF0127 family)